MKNTSIEIYNYLNITNRRLGKLYKLTGYSPLPKDFILDKDKIKEQLILSQLQKDDIFPPFIFDEKKHIKKYFKNSQKNCKKIKKHEFYNKNTSKEFKQKLDIYFDMRMDLCDMILKDFNGASFDETAAYQELYNLNPILAPYMECLFTDKVDFETLFSDLEQKYEKSYLEKINLLEEKNKKKTKKEQELSENIQRQKVVENSKKVDKNNKKIDKIAENKQKIEKKKEIKKTKETIKQAKIEHKVKEK